MTSVINEAKCYFGKYYAVKYYVGRKDVAKYYDGKVIRSKLLRRETSNGKSDRRIRNFWKQLDLDIMIGLEIEQMEWRVEIKLNDKLILYDVGISYVHLGN